MTKPDKVLTIQLLHEKLEVPIMFDLEALKDCFINKNSKDFEYHFALLKGNLEDLFNGVNRNE